VVVKLEKTPCLQNHHARRGDLFRNVGPTRARAPRNGCQRLKWIKNVGSRTAAGHENFPRSVLEKYRDGVGRPDPVRSNAIKSGCLIIAPPLAALDIWLRTGTADFDYAGSLHPLLEASQQHSTLVLPIHSSRVGVNGGVFFSTKISNARARGCSPAGVQLWFQKNGEKFPRGRPGRRRYKPSATIDEGPISHAQTSHEGKAGVDRRGPRKSGRRIFRIYNPRDHDSGNATRAAVSKHFPRRLSRNRLPVNAFQKRIASAKSQQLFGRHRPVRSFHFRRSFR